MKSVTMQLIANPGGSPRKPARYVLTEQAERLIAAPKMRSKDEARLDLCIAKSGYLSLNRSLLN